MSLFHVVCSPDLFENRLMMMDIAIIEIDMELRGFERENKRSLKAHHI